MFGFCQKCKEYHHDSKPCEPLFIVSAVVAKGSPKEVEIRARTAERAAWGWAIKIDVAKKYGMFKDVDVIVRNEEGTTEKFKIWAQYTIQNEHSS